MLAKCASARSKSLAFQGDACAGGNAVISASMRSLNAAVEPSLLKVSWRVSRGPPALGFFAAGCADIARCKASAATYECGLFTTKRRGHVWNARHFHLWR